MTITIFANVIVIGCVNSGRLNDYGLMVNLIVQGGFNYYTNGKNYGGRFAPRSGYHALPDVIIHRDISIANLHLA